MDRMKSNKGITLVALAITVIVLLILAGVIVIILDNIIIDKAVVASNKTIEESLKEQIELIWDDCEASYWNEKKHMPDINKDDYFKEKLTKDLEEMNDFKHSEVTGNIEETLTINFKYKNKKYTFDVSPNGKVKLVYLLKGNVKVGDYVEYPIEYNDVYSEEHYTKSTGWRVIDDGVMKGTIGTVKLVSTGIPAKWYYNPAIYENNSKALDVLNNDFENLDLINQNKEKIKGAYFKVEGITNKIATVSLHDLNYAYNAIYKTNRDAEETSELSQKNELFYMNHIDACYCLQSKKINDNLKIYCVNDNNIIEYFDLRIGIRPVIYLDENQTGTWNSNAWNLKN